LIAVAKALNKPIYFTWGATGTYRWDMATTVDLTGIPWIDGDGVIIDTSNATATQSFQDEGGRSAALASGIWLTAGMTISETISTSDLPVGATLVICSLEQTENTSVEYYFKGGMFRVVANDAAGTIELDRPIPYDFTNSAYLYRID